MPIPDSVEATIENCVAQLSEEHRDIAKKTLEASWGIGGLIIEDRKGNYRYLASWKHQAPLHTWLATVYVCTEVARATCPG